jgi:plasmid stabilization system protein ParE
VRVEFHPEADAELSAQFEFYQQQQAGLGHRFYLEVLACVDWLRENPTLPRARKGFRRINLKVFPFYIAYVVEADVIWVLAVAHGSRKPGYWKGRL